MNIKELIDTGKPIDVIAAGLVVERRWKELFALVKYAIHCGIQDGQRGLQSDNEPGGIEKARGFKP